MITYRSPTEAALAALLTSQAGSNITYSPSGCTRDANTLPPFGFQDDRYEIQLGIGEAAFRAACNAVRNWQMFPRGWIRIFPESPSIVVGTDVAVIANLFGSHIVNACRIVETFGGEAERHFGFAYGTLPAHLEMGEERFEVNWREDDTVWYRIRAISKPRFWLARLGYPIARICQRRFGRDSMESMRRAV